MTEYTAGTAALEGRTTPPKMKQVPQIRTNCCSGLFVKRGVFMFDDEVELHTVPRVSTRAILGHSNTFRTQFYIDSTFSGPCSPKVVVLFFAPLFAVVIVVLIAHTGKLHRLFVDSIGARPAGRRVSALFQLTIPGWTNDTISGSVFGRWGRDHR